MTRGEWRALYRFHWGIPMRRPLLRSLLRQGLIERVDDRPNGRYAFRLTTGGYERAMDQLRGRGRVS